MAQLQAVRAAGCHEIQGYLVSVPKPLKEFPSVADFDFAEKIHTT
jgi:EAL domain-containing protein (putative c-di-GMP-specific phosphodiesterase class I)